MAVCPKCGTQVPNTSKFCTECGYPMNVPDPTPAPAPAPAPSYSAPVYTPTPAPEAPKPARSGRGKAILLISLAVLLLAGATVGVLFLTGVLGGNKDYDRAMDLYKSGNYAEAADLFEQVGDYKDSAEMANTCRYQQAVAAFNQENYTEAMRLFQGLGSYKDSADWVEKCEQRIDYDRAVTLYNQGDYEAAAEIFEGLGDYKDSADRAEQCRKKLFNPVGTYHLVGIKIDGEDYSDYISMLGYESYEIVFNEDGTGRLSGDGSNVKFKWDGNIMDDGSDRIPFTCENDMITFESSGVEMTFARGAAPASSGSPTTASAPSGTYVGYYNGKVFSTVTFYADGSFTEKMEGQSETWHGTWVIEGNQITSTYSDGSHDYYTWDPVNDTLDWKGEGKIIYKHP